MAFSQIRVFYIIVVGSKLGLIINSLVIHSVPLITQLDIFIHYGKISWNIIGINGNKSSANSGKYCSYFYFVYGKNSSIGGDLIPLTVVAKGLRTICNLDKIEFMHLFGFKIDRSKYHCNAYSRGKV